MTVHSGGGGSGENVYNVVVYWDLLEYVSRYSRVSTTNTNFNIYKKEHVITLNLSLNKLKKTPEHSAKQTVVVDDDVFIHCFCCCFLFG